MLPGVHRVRKALRGGEVAEYWYAWRGGPQILKAVAKSDALLDREVAALTPAAATAWQAARRPTADRKFLYGLITRYLESVEFGHGAPRTRKDRRKFLDRCRTELGTMELKALEARGARAALIKWRDRYAATPKTADELLGALSIVLQWATDRGEILANPLKDFPRLYRVNRADLIWEPHHLASLMPHCAPELEHAVRLAALTGLRLGDLIRLPWTAVGEHAVVWQTGKSRGRRTVVIPITTPLRALFEEIPRRDCVTVLSSARRRPWTEPGLESALRRAKLDAAAAAALAGRDGSGLEGLRFHDLRGTAATNLIRAGLDLADVATVLGWKKSKVEEIAARYVTAQEIGLAMVERLRRNEAARAAQ
jgi:integrase